LLRLARHRSDRAPCRLCRPWLEVLREDNRAIVRAASQASKAADFLLAFLPSDDAQTATANERPRNAPFATATRAVTQSRIRADAHLRVTEIRPSRGRGLSRSS
jgi:hypothetical protein